MDDFELAEALAGKTTLVLGGAGPGPDPARLARCAADEMAQRELVDQVTHVELEGYDAPDSPEFDRTPEPGWLGELIADARNGTRTLVVVTVRDAGAWRRRSLTTLLHNRRFYLATVIVLGNPDGVGCVHGNFGYAQIVRPTPQFASLFDVVAAAASTDNLGAAQISTDNLGAAQISTDVDTASRSLLRRLGGAVALWRPRPGHFALYDLGAEAFLEPWSPDD